jgi:hypothetical protein
VSYAQLSLQVCKKFHSQVSWKNAEYNEQPVMLSSGLITLWQSGSALSLHRTETSQHSTDDNPAEELAASTRNPLPGTDFNFTVSWYTRSASAGALLSSSAVATTTGCCAGACHQHNTTAMEMKHSHCHSGPANTAEQPSIDTCLQSAIQQHCYPAQSAPASPCNYLCSAAL